MSIDLTSFSCFDQTVRQERLLYHLELQSTYMPHQIANATGCSLEQSLGLLFVLYNASLVQVQLLVYHNLDGDSPPILARELSEGMPRLPFTCDLCERRITTPEELSYDLLFVRTDSLNRMIRDNELLRS